MMNIRITRHIPVERKFAPTSHEELRDPNYPNILGERRGDLNWETLLERNRVVVLGEGKCGKTHEFKHQLERLKSEDQLAFFLPLERLHVGEIEDELEPNDWDRLSEWQNDGSSRDVAYFFLDAVDELKLQKGSLRRALNKLRKIISSKLDLAKVYISCRPGDWNNEIDLEDLKYIAPSPKQTALVEDKEDELTGPKFFIKGIARDSQKHENIEDTHASSSEEFDQVLIVSLVGLSREEVLDFSKQYDPQSAERLIEELDKHELWDLYQTPFEIRGALDQLTGRGQLGTLQDQLIYGINQKIKEVEYGKRQSLSEAKSLQGAQEIALALYLANARSIVIDDATCRDGHLRVEDTLPNWSREERIELLGKSLFDPTGVGAVRFHHRSSQEFLAAQQLNDLVKKGLSTRELHSFLFGEFKGQKIVFPSMEAVAAWLALEHSSVWQEVKRRKPEILFQQGLPGSMNLRQKSDLLRDFVAKYADSTWRRLNIGIREMQRFADPNLHNLVRELWDQAYTGDDTRSLMLDLIYLTPLPECADLAELAAYDSGLKSLSDRAEACLGILAAGNPRQKKRLIQSMLTDSWSPIVIRRVLKHLTPDQISVDQFVQLAEKCRPETRDSFDSSYALKKAATADHNPRERIIAIRDRLAAKLWDARSEHSKYHTAISTYGYFKGAIIASAAATIPNTDEAAEDWAWALTLGLRFNKDGRGYVSDDQEKQIIVQLKAQSRLREAYVWARLKFHDELEDGRSPHSRAWDAHDYHRAPLQTDDQSWLLATLEDPNRGHKRDVALHLLQHAFRIYENPELAEQIKNYIADRSDLLDTLDRWLNPPEQEPSEFDLKHQRWELKRNKSERERKSGWLRWHRQVMRDPNFLLGEEKREYTLYNVYNYLSQALDNGSSWGKWDANWISQSFSADFLDHYRRELSRYWREQDDIKLRSEREPEKRGTYQHNWLMALAALKSESETRGWAENLSESEATKAAKIALIELNGFGNFFEDLEKAHPSCIHAVIKTEVSAQMAMIAAGEKADIFHDLFYHGAQIRGQAGAEAIAENLALLAGPDDEANGDQIKYALQVLARYGTQNDISLAIQTIESWIEDPGLQSPQALAKSLEALSFFDLERASQQVLRCTVELGSVEQRERAEAIFAAVFGDRDSDAPLDFGQKNVSEKVPLIKALLIRAYQAVRLKDDIVHDGAFSPGRREHAESARNRLFSALTKLEVPSAITAIVELSECPEFAHNSGYLKQIASGLAAKIVEPSPMSAKQIHGMNQAASYTARDHDSLMVLVQDRLTDFESELMFGQFSIRPTIIGIEHETKLRPYIAGELDKAAREAYSIHQEVEVAEEKRTDIRVQPSTMKEHATIELKLTHPGRWTANELLDALKNQLVGQYLSSPECQVGVLLICMRISRKWKNPKTKVNMNLDQLIEWLQSHADQIMLENEGMKLWVKGIDYSLRPEVK